MPMEHKKQAHDAWTRRVNQSAAGNTLCLILDFSESIQLPYFRVRPSGLYFLSMPVVHICGVYDCSKLRYHQHDINVRLDTQGSFKNSDGVVSSLYFRLAKEGRADKPVDILLDNTCSQNKNRYTMAGFQWLCMLGKASEIRVWFLDVGHTKSALDSLFGAIKLVLRRYRRVMSLEELCAALAVTTCTPNVPEFIFDWRSKCEDLKVKGIPHIKKMFYFVINKDGVRCRSELEDGDLSPPQNMFPGVKSIPLQTVKHAKPIAPQPNRSKGLRVAFKHMNSLERAFWYRIGYAAVVQAAETHNQTSP